ncbi:MAG: Lrp/AsnC family transcriptional regulator [Thermoplasmata archaeon]|nr:MAG: Lrp/AsnC family transcriptional regulator [Thermoplasmata archaeon]
MVVGYILIKTEAAKEHSVYERLKHIEEVVEVHALFGEYDFIVKLEAEDFNKLGEIVVDKIRAIDGVKDTETLTGPDTLSF